jgi:hypothetical protein
MQFTAEAAPAGSQRLLKQDMAVAEKLLLLD